MRKRLRMAAAVAALLLATPGPRRAAAQDSKSSLRTERLFPSAALDGSCDERATLLLCVEPRGDSGEGLGQLKEKQYRQRAPLTGFTRLAGKFMGRAGLASVGHWQLRIDLSLR